MAHNLLLEWTHQPATPLGVEKVPKLEVKLRSLNVPGLDCLKSTYKHFSKSPFLQAEEAETEFTELLVNIGSWPQSKKEYVQVFLVLLS